MAGLLLIPLGALIGVVAGAIIGMVMGRNIGETNRETYSSMRAGMFGGACGGILGAIIDLITGGSFLLYILSLVGGILGSATGTTGGGLKRIPREWFSRRHS